MMPSRHMRRTSQIRGASVLGVRRNALSYPKGAPRALFLTFSGARAEVGRGGDEIGKVRPGFHRRFADLRVLAPLNFDGLFLTPLCTIRPLSDESLAPLSRGANAFWGVHGFAAIRKAPAARSLKSAGLDCFCYSQCSTMPDPKPAF